MFLASLAPSSATSKSGLEAATQAHLYPFFGLKNLKMGVPNLQVSIHFSFELWDSWGT